MFFQSLTKEELISHGVSEKFAKVLTNPKDVHKYLDIFVGKTYADYFIPKGVKNVIPLWDINGDSFARWERCGNTEYIWLFHDDPEWIYIAKSEQGVMAELYGKWWEFQDDDEALNNANCTALATAMGFSYQKEADLLLVNDWDSYGDWVKSL